MGQTDVGDCCLNSENYLKLTRMQRICELFQNSSVAKDSSFYTLWCSLVEVSSSVRVCHLHGLQYAIMSCCSVHNVYHKPTLCESLARAKILQGECKYPETNNQVVKRLHVLLKSTPAAICPRFLAIRCGGLVTICTIGYETRQNVACYVPVVSVQ